MQEVLRHEVEPVKAAKRLLNACRDGLHGGRRFDDPASEHGIFLRGELVVEALQGLAPGEEGRPGVVEAREEGAYAREI